MTGLKEAGVALKILYMMFMCYFPSTNDSKAHSSQLLMLKEYDGMYRKGKRKNRKYQNWWAAFTMDKGVRSGREIETHFYLLISLF